MNSNHNVSLSPRREEEYQPTTGIYGTVQDRFRRVREAFAKNLDTGQDIGASVAMFIDGELVVDAGVLQGERCPRASRSTQAASFVHPQRARMRSIR